MWSPSFVPGEPAHGERERARLAVEPHDLLRCLYGCCCLSFLHIYIYIYIYTHSCLFVCIVINIYWLFVCWLNCCYCFLSSLFIGIFKMLGVGFGGSYSIGDLRQSRLLLSLAQTVSTYYYYHHY